MPGKVKVRIIAGRNLPVMDKSSDTSDAFVEVKLGNTTYKTEVYRHSLNPCWNSDCFRFEVDDEELQDEPLQIRIMDYDTYSANDAIGKVYIDLNPLLYKDSVHAMWGWFPIYDTMHGIRGEVHCAVKVDLFSDSNRFRQSSCGVRFFYSPGIPYGYSCQAILGFVEELVVNDDPKYQWIDKIRTHRASNEARQTLFSKLSGEVKRKIGLKALELGGNSVVGYQQYFDLEGEAGIVVRGIGTAVVLTKVENATRNTFHGRHGHLSQQSPQITNLPSQTNSSSIPSANEQVQEALPSHVPTTSKYQDSSNGLYCCCVFCDSENNRKLSPPACFISRVKIPVAFLSNVEMPMPYPYSYFMTSSPLTNSRSSSPVFASNASPKSAGWLSRLARSSFRKTNSSSIQSKPDKANVEIFISSNASPTFKSRPLNLNCTKSTLKRVASQPVALASSSVTINRTSTSPCPLNGNKLSPQPISSASSLSLMFSSAVDSAKYIDDDENTDDVNPELRQHPHAITISHPFLPLRLTPINNMMAQGNINPSNPNFCEKEELVSSFSPPNDACLNQRKSTTTPAIATTFVNSHHSLQSNGQAASPHNKFFAGSPGMPSSCPGSSDPDLTSATEPKTGSSHSSLCGSVGKSNFKFMISPESLHLLEYPFITMKQFPPGFIAHIGGTVSSRSVKLLDHINSPDDPETRDAWWMELRKEIRSHCKSLACNAVLGYSEATYISDNVVILSASGTAVVLCPRMEGCNSASITSGGKELERLEVFDCGKCQISAKNDSNKTKPTVAASAVSNIDHQSLPFPASCSIFHIPYPESSVPFHSLLLKCNVCKKAKVSDVIFMTIEPLPNIPIVGKGCLIQARVCRNKRDSKGEQCAKEISDSLPFLEHELHRQLLSKVKVKGMNAIFGLSVQISFGENMLVALATGTAAYVAPLSPPKPPQVSSGKGVNTTDLNAIQKLIFESISRNREHYGLSHIPMPQETESGPAARNRANSNVKSKKDEEDDISCTGADLVIGSKDGCVVLEVDDTEDADIISLMIDSDVPAGYEICNTENMPGITNQFTGILQTFAQVHRVKLMTIKQFGQQFDWIIQGLFDKLRRLVPCSLTDLKFRVDLPEQDLVQVTVLGSAIGLAGPPYTTANGKPTLYQPSTSSRGRHTYSGNDSCDDLLFTMEDDNYYDDADGCARRCNLNPDTGSFNGIELTPLSYIPGAHIQKYLGNLDFFFIRETTSIKENGGLNGFIHSFLSEVFAIVRAHVAGLSGNAMVSLHLTQCVLPHNPHKNQAQCMINIAGDAVCIQSCPSKNLTEKS